MGEDALSNHPAGLNDAVLFDRIDLLVGAQRHQLIPGELSGVTVDEVELMNDIAWGGCNFALGRANVGSERHPLLEGNDVTARDGFSGFSYSEKGGHWGTVP